MVDHGSLEAVVGTGLRNYRNNCFFNSTLQALFHIPSIINCMLDNEHRHGSNFYRNSDLDRIFYGCNLYFTDKCMTCSLRDTFIQTRQWTRSLFPSNLYGLLKNHHEDLFDGECQDAHNFLLCLLNSTKSLQHFDSTISSKFLSEIVSTSTCKECGGAFTKSAEYFSLQIDIIETAHIDDAFRKFFEEEIVSKYCDHCKKNVDAVKQFKIKRPPSVLCLQIKRFSGRAKKNDCVQILHELTISKMQYQGDIDIKYKLSSIICHSGSWRSGHYKTIVCGDGELYEFNDARVKQITYTNIIKSEEAYILLYEMQNRSNISLQAEVN